MGTVVYTILILLAGFAIGLVAPIWWWKRKLWKLDLVWRMNFAAGVHLALAQLLGGRVENGIVHLPGHASSESEDTDPSKKLN